MFVVLVDYLKPIEAVDAFLVPHRAYLDTLYARKVLLASGPQVPRTGGLLLARGVSKDELRTLLDGDPFAQEGIARYNIIEFDPVKHCQELKDIL
jgi:uncharacterized protein YciI